MTDRDDAQRVQRLFRSFLPHQEDPGEQQRVKSIMTNAKRRKRTRLAKNARIAVVGGGLGGLGTAISLQKEGFTNVTVYERDLSPEPTVQNTQEGYGLTLSYNPQGPLAHMGILEEVARQDCPSRSHYIFEPDGSVLGYYGNAFLQHRGLGQRGNLRVPRQILRLILLKQVNNTIEWGKRLTRFDYCSDKEKIQLYFDDGTVSTDIDLLVGADGLRSLVVRTLLARTGDETVGLRFLGVMIILGISNLFHPLLDERGFYTVDGEHRLFTMPYEGSKLEDEEHHGVPETTGSATQDTTTEDVQTNGQKRRRIMWQLSYRLGDESEARRLRESGPQALRDEVLRRCEAWHKPVVDMVQSTPLETIWGTGLMDRDPEELLQQFDPELSSRVVVVGDAAHSMSPFKGQGANQALLDGPLLASWLLRASAPCAVRGFMREMAVRTGAKVRASREAATMLHSPQVVSEKQDFAGVQRELISTLMGALRERNIDAAHGKWLDDSIREVIEELGLGVDLAKNDQPSITISEEERKVQDQALHFSAQGDTVGLRNLSLQHSSAIRCAQDEQKRTCLHLAALGGHYHCCRWLLGEAFVPHNTLDAQKSTPLQAAILNGDASVIALLSARSKD